MDKVANTSWRKLTLDDNSEQSHPALVIRFNWPSHQLMDVILDAAPPPTSLCTSDHHIQRFFSQNKTSSPLGHFCHQRTSSRIRFCVFQRTYPHERTTFVFTIVSHQLLSDMRGYDAQRQASRSSLVAQRERGQQAFFSHLFRPDEILEFLR